VSLLRLAAGTVHYRESGQGEPVVLLHANPGDSRDFDAVMPELARHFRVLALDWPGYGESPLPERIDTIGPDFFHAVLREFVQALDLPPAWFVGNSLGGNAAARFVIDKPERARGLVLVAPGGFTTHDALTRAFCRLQGSRLALSPRLFATHYLRHRTPVVEAMLERAANEQATPERLALNRAVWRSFATAENDLRDRARAIRVPTLLLFGRDDPVIRAGRDGLTASSRIPGARLAVLPCGHASFAEMPGEFLEQVLPFLSQR
jgi:pimeloyl-ACP methyl ester carboxylesterase